jgi:hypothetical protein
MFRRFSELPAELRANIWSLALHDDYWALHGCSRFIEIHAYNIDLEEFAIAISRRYPTVYHVIRESRYEAAKLEGCEFVTLQGRYSSKRTTASTTGVEFCVNFARDTFLVSKRFTEHDINTLLPSPQSSNEEARLTHFAQIFPAAVRAKVERIHLVATARSPYDDSVWYGRPLDLFTSLKRIRILPENDHVRRRLQWSLNAGMRVLWKGVCATVPEIAFELELEEDYDWYERMHPEEWMAGIDDLGYGTPAGVVPLYDEGGIIQEKVLKGR